jgi:hypothetical protein
MSDPQPAVSFGLWAQRVETVGRSTGALAGEPDLALRQLRHTAREEHRNGKTRRRR